jgi:CubicO group peptidase (beta-lactamase class C family)
VRIAIALAALLALAGTGNDRLVGLWGSEHIYGPQVRGELTVDGRFEPWRASIGGYAVDVRRNGNRIDFALPGNAGTFRGSIAADGGLAGLWVQPASLPVGVPYASPVSLEQRPAGVWRGEVRPLANAFSLYLAVSRTQRGVLRAFLRNPEANVGMGRPFVVRASGSSIAFVGADDPSDAIRGSYDASADRLTLDVPVYGRFVFTRRSRDDAPGFYPRTPPVERWAYRVPLPLEDGWSTASLADAGIDPAPIGALVNGILTTPTTSFRSPYVQALLIARHGKLVLDEYFYGFDAERTHDMRSAGKSITGLMTGIALDRGAPFTLDTPAVSLFPQYAALANPSERKNRITVRDLLTMTSGLACDDKDDASPGNEDRMYAQTVQPDYYKYALDVPMAAQPGTATAVYCTIGINLLGGIVSSAAKMPLADFFAAYVARPLDIRDYHLNLMPNGDAYAGGGLYLRPRDALKLGQLYLNGGVWNGRRVVDASWVALSTQQHSAFPASAYASSHGYGFAWHIFALPSGGRTYRTYMAQGNGGQIVAVLPDLDAVVLVMAGNYNNFPTWRAFYEELIPKYVIPAMATPAAR